MTDPISIALIGASLLLIVALACLAGLKGWSEWLDYKRLELASQSGEVSLPRTGGRIAMCFCACVRSGVAPYIVHCSERR